MENRMFSNTSLKSESIKENLINLTSKHALKLKNNNNGNLLSIHHTINDQILGDNKVKQFRIKLAVSCFNCHGSYIVIDKRGNTFVFDFAVKQYWKLPICLPKANILKSSNLQPNQYLLGTKTGCLQEFDTGKLTELK